MCNFPFKGILNRSSRAGTFMHMNKFRLIYVHISSITLCFYVHVYVLSESLLNTSASELILYRNTYIGRYFFTFRPAHVHKANIENWIWKLKDLVLAESLLVNMIFLTNWRCNGMRPLRPKIRSLRLQPHKTCPLGCPAKHLILKF